MSNTVNVIHIKASPEEAAENLLDTLKGELQRKGDVLCNAWTELHTLLSQPGVVTVEDPSVLSTLQDKGTLLSSTWNELYNLIAAYQTELSSRESQVVTAWAQIQSKEQLAGELRKKNATLEEELRKKSESMSTTQATITALLSQQKKFDNVSGEKQALINKYQSDLEDRETVLSNMTLENMALTAKVEELESHVHNIDPNRAEREETLEKYKSEMLSLTEENSLLAEKLKKATKVSEPVEKITEVKQPNGVKFTRTGNVVMPKVTPTEKKKAVPIIVSKAKESNGGQGDAKVVILEQSTHSNTESVDTETPIRKTRSAAIDTDTPTTPASTPTNKPETPVVPTRSSGRRRKAEIISKIDETSTVVPEESSPLRSKRGRLIKAKLKSCLMGLDCPYCKHHVNVKENCVVEGNVKVILGQEYVEEEAQKEINEQKKEADRQNRSYFNAEKARTTVDCVECGKSRVVYSLYKCSEDEKDLLEVYLGDIKYTCGTALFPKDCGLYPYFIVREYLSCCSPIELSYYRQDHLIPICYHCGTSEDLVKSEAIVALQHEYSTVAPICQSCMNMGLHPFTRGPITKT